MGPAVGLLGLHLRCGQTPKVPGPQPVPESPSVFPLVPSTARPKATDTTRHLPQAPLMGPRPLHPRAPLLLCVAYAPPSVGPDLSLPPPLPARTPLATPPPAASLQMRRSPLPG